MSEVKAIELPPGLIEAERQLLANFKSHYFTVRQAAMLLGMKEQSLSNMRHNGRGPSYYQHPMTKRIYYRIDDLREYLVGQLVRTEKFKPDPDATDAEALEHLEKVLAAEQQEKADAG